MRLMMATVVEENEEEQGHGGRSLFRHLPLISSFTPGLPRDRHETFCLKLLIIPSPRGAVPYHHVQHAIGLKVLDAVR